MLGHIYAVAQQSWHSIPDHQWDAFPDEMLLQIHWRREPEFRDELRDHGFRVLTIARHPFDVLISILHFCVYNAHPVHLGGTADDQEIWGAMPRSRSFLEYANSPRAKSLLAITGDWWQQPDCISVRYEDCVAYPIGEMNKLVAELGPPRVNSAEKAVELCSLSTMRKTSINNHYWQGRPGLWRELLPVVEATELAEVVREPLAKLGYDCDPDPILTPSQADANWIRYTGTALGETLHKNTLGHQTQIQEMRQREELALARLHAAQAEAEHSRVQFDAARAELATIVAERDAVRQEMERFAANCDALRANLDETRKYAAQFAGLNGAAIRFAHVFQRLRNRMPLPAKLAKRVFAGAR